jgi:hypothetical protein
LEEHGFEIHHRFVGDVEGAELEGGFAGLRERDLADGVAERVKWRRSLPAVRASWLPLRAGGTAWHSTTW